MMGGVALQLLELAQLATLAAVAGRAFSSVTVFLLTFVLLLVVVEARRHYRVNHHIRHPTASFLELQKHPGIVAEIKSRVGVDETTRDVTIELTGTIHRDMNSTHTPPKGACEMRDYVALGTQALSDAARKLAEQSNKEASFAEHGDETAETQHGDIQRILQNGKVIWVEAMGEVMGKYGHPCYRLRLQDDKDAESDTPRVIDCVFKPALEGHGDGWHRAPMEYVAYKLSRMLGMDLVPPAAYRRPEEGIQVDYKTFNEGAFLYWVDGADDLCKTGDYDTAVRTGCWGEGVDPRVILSDTRVLDVLLQNSDRHEGHTRHADALEQRAVLVELGSARASLGQAPSSACRLGARGAAAAAEEGRPASMGGRT